MGHTHKRPYPLPKECTRNILRDLQKIVKDLEGSPNPKEAYLSSELLRKYADPDKGLALVRQQAAIEKWLAVETCNATTNQRLYLDLDDEPLIIGGIEVNVLIERAARLIRRVIGDAPPVIDLYGSFSGGASTSIRRQPGMVERKYSGKVNVSHKAWDLIWPSIYRSPVWVNYNPQALTPEFCDHSVLFTVPKTDTIDRVACKEPDYNMWMQKGVGAFIRRRLRRRCGIDLNDQSRNRDLAREALTLGLATVDLSSASDSVTTQLICRLLPVDWFVYMDRLRVHQVLLPDGTMHSLEMFSSMGNGFTFELESLVFWALTRALCGPDHVVSVYGDDIIMPSTHFEDLVVLFKYCGFTINTSKSFATGPFRESCGGHYHNGSDITPFYVKGPIVCVSQLINLLNSVRRWSMIDGNSSWCSDVLEPFWRRYAPYVPSPLWGGSDIFSTETLASPRGAGRRLVRVTTRLDADWIERGAYIQWHSIRDTRDSAWCLQKRSQHLERGVALALEATHTMADSSFLSDVGALGLPHSVRRITNLYSIRNGHCKHVFGPELPLFPFEV